MDNDALHLRGRHPVSGDDGCRGGDRRCGPCVTSQRYQLVERLPDRADSLATGIAVSAIFGKGKAMRDQAPLQILHGRVHN